jgi:hypothetical protein
VVAKMLRTKQNAAKRLLSVLFFIVHPLSKLNSNCLV